MSMSNDRIIRNAIVKTSAITENAPALVKKMGKTTYRVSIHFSTTSSETMSDKIKRMLRKEISQM